jgi:hypothetical protein
VTEIWWSLCEVFASTGAEKRAISAHGIVCETLLLFFSATDADDTICTVAVPLLLEAMS